MTNCKNCENPITENFCSNCGQQVTLKRIDNHYIQHEFLHLLHFEKGFFYTAKELIVRPGDSIREFIKNDRAKHMKPVPFLILTSLLYTIVAHFLHADDIATEKEKLLLAKSSIGSIQHWIQAHYGYANIISGFFYAICIMLFFKKYKYNFFEITVLLCFLMGQQMLLLTIMTFFFPVLGAEIYKNLLLILTFAYSTWAIGQFFDRARMASYIKAFFAYLLGNILWILAIIIIGVAADIILKLTAHH